MDSERIFSFLEKVEGRLQTRGYIPCYCRGGHTANYRGYGDPDDYTAMGASGVTIGIGVDLGQQSRAQLCKWSVPPRLVDRLTPYLGKQRGYAIEALHAAPLFLPEADAKALTIAEQTGYLRDTVIPWWDSKGGVRFEDMPVEAQTALFSFVYQCGPKGAERRGPNTLKALLKGDYCKAALCLMDRTGWNGEYVNRRFQEGMLMERFCK